MELCDLGKSVALWSFGGAYMEGSGSIYHWFIISSSIGHSDNL